MPVLKPIVSALVPLAGAFALACSLIACEGQLPDEALSERQLELNVATDWVWDIEEIPVCWNNPTPDDADERALVQRSIEQTWQRSSGITFTGWAECPPWHVLKTSGPVGSGGIAITIADENPRSKIGKLSAYYQTSMWLNFDFVEWSPVCGLAFLRDRCIRDNAIHEFGHALAFRHEHDHPEAGAQCDDDTGTHGDTLGTPFDHDSIMNYCQPGFDGGLSGGDVWGIQELYGAPEWTDYIDEVYYLARYKDVADAGMSAVHHYTHWGGLEGRDPNPFFDGSWYLAVNPDVKAAKMNPLKHYIKWGAGEGRDPHPLFDVSWYREENQTTLELPDAWESFVDEAAYFDAYPDVAASGLGAAYHYGQWGWKKGRSSHAPCFDGEWYLDTNPDVKAAKMNPLKHYIEWGQFEGRKPSGSCGGPAFFDSNAVIVPDHRLSAFDHFLFHGSHRGYQTSPSSKWQPDATRQVFDPAFYLTIHPDVAAHGYYGLHPAEHFVKFGHKEGRRPSRDFDPSAYLQAHPDVAAAVANGTVRSAFYHWITWGLREGRTSQ